MLKEISFFLYAYALHVYNSVLAHRDIKLGLASGVTGGVAYEVGKSNIDMWAELGHAVLIVSFLGGILALIRGGYSFYKEVKKDRAEALKTAQEIEKVKAG